jgi:hypothetical protein
MQLFSDAISSHCNGCGQNAPRQQQSGIGVQGGHVSWQGQGLQGVEDGRECLKVSVPDQTGRKSDGNIKDRHEGNWGMPEEKLEKPDNTR